MKIEICSSLAFAKKLVGLKQKLESLEHKVEIPPFIDKYITLDTAKDIRTESTENKIKHDIIREYFCRIVKCDTILVANYKKNEVAGYVGSNTLIEMAFAHVLNKPIYMLNQIPNTSSSDEIRSMNPIILNGDLNKIKNGNTS